MLHSVGGPHSIRWGPWQRGWSHPERRKFYWKMTSAWSCLCSGYLLLSLLSGHDVSQHSRSSSGLYQLSFNCFLNLFLFIITHLSNLSSWFLFQSFSLDISIINPSISLSVSPYLSPPLALVLDSSSLDNLKHLYCYKYQGFLQLGLSTHIPIDSVSESPSGNTGMWQGPQRQVTLIDKMLPMLTMSYLHWCLFLKLRTLISEIERVPSSQYWKDKHPKSHLERDINRWLPQTLMHS